jgi:uncharacterized protein
MAATPSDLIAQCEAFVRAELAGNDSSHDWFHIDRVRKLAVTLGKREAVADLESVELAAMLHDLKDWKYSGDDDAGPAAAHEWLIAHGLASERAELIKLVIASIGFKTEISGSSPADAMTGDARKIFEVVQDADRLDAIGAIGIARCLTFGGAHGRVMHDPSVPPKLDMSKEEYKKNKGTSINHFYEKLLTLKDRMKTASGRAVADERHAFMRSFLDRFHSEWEGLC